jgi:hypothetical protein
MVRIVRQDGHGRLYVLDNHGREMFFDGTGRAQFPVPGMRVQMLDLRHGRFASGAFCVDIDDPPSGPLFSGHFHRYPTLQNIVAQLAWEAGRK